MGAPNIFDYATSELSQDAFLCWLIACADCDDASLKNLGLEFIRFLYDSKNADTQQTKVQGLVKTMDTEKPYPWQQYGKIDVYFQATINDKKVSFVIEDKTGTAMHDDQLKRYATFVAEDGIEEDEVQLIYFKTGYINPKEKADAEGKNFIVIDLEDCIKFLSSHEKNIKNDIFRSYFTYVKKISEERKKILNEACDFHVKEGGKSYNDIFRHPYAQYYLMDTLRKNISNVAELISDKEIYQEKERGGLWTQLDFYKISREKNENDPEQLYWRMDDWKQLTLRHVWGGQDRGERLDKFRQIFQEVGEPIFGKAYQYPRGKTGKNSRVAEIYFNSPESSVQNILARMPDFCEKFIKRIQSDQVLSMRL